MSTFQQPPWLVQPPPVVEDPSIREIFSDNLVGVVIGNGNFTLPLPCLGLSIRRCRLQIFGRSSLVWCYLFMR